MRERRVTCVIIGAIVSSAVVVAAQTEKASLVDAMWFKCVIRAAKNVNRRSFSQVNLHSDARKLAWLPASPLASILPDRRAPNDLPGEQQWDGLAPSLEGSRLTSSVKERQRRPLVDGSEATTGDDGNGSSITSIARGPARSERNRPASAISARPAATSKVGSLYPLKAPYSPISPSPCFTPRSASKGPSSMPHRALDSRSGSRILMLTRPNA